MDLSGRWRACVADEALRRTYPEPDFDDRAWPELDVPGHWRTSPAFAGTDGPLLYRTRFDLSRPADGSRSWLVLDGLFYQGDVWLDGAYVGDTEGYFFPHTFEVTDAARDRSEHVLAVEVACAPQRERKAKRNITGVFQDWDCIDPDWNPGGIWRPVHIEQSGPVRISRYRVLCQEASQEQAVLNVRAVLDASEATTAQLRTQVGTTTEHTQEQPLAAGENRVNWQVTVERPALWWPHALGDQPLHDVTLEVRAGDTDAPSDTRSVRTGLRQVRMKNWITTVNGERLFLKGSNQGPTRTALADARPDELERDVVLAKEAGLDVLRLLAHISRPELYDAADRHGLLLWQDFPLQWTYARGIRKQAARQVREAVDLLGHHPSVAIWCGHNDPISLGADPVAAMARPTRSAATYLTHQELPSWNKTVLDATVKRAFEKSDGSRPVIPHSGVLPHPGSVGTDTHAYFGWYHGDERDFPAMCAAFPRLARFVSEFGAQAVPTVADFMHPERWPQLDWEELQHRHSMQKPIFDRHVPPAEFDTFAQWQAATQRYQADVIRFHIETLRRLKYRPTGGFCQFSLGDSDAAVTWSVLDHQREPKLGYDALAAACAPVIVVADRPDAEYHPGDPLALDVHVVSDLRASITSATVTARLGWRDGEHRWSWEGDVPADGCVRIGTVQALAPAAAGQLTLDLELSADGVKAANSYVSSIVSP
ncbi:MAG: beta-mannosidase [Actinomycetota bacterium]